jgi:Flp pilus assembly pilin Flp
MPTHAALYRWLTEEDGQDVTEYTLLLAFVALVSGALFFNGAGSISKIWTSTTSYLSTPS